MIRFFVLLCFTAFSAAFGYFTSGRLLVLAMPRPKFADWVVATFIAVPWIFPCLFMALLAALGTGNKGYCRSMAWLALIMADLSGWFIAVAWGYGFSWWVLLPLVTSYLAYTSLWDFRRNTL
jgi:hypothetical protein